MITFEPCSTDWLQAQLQSQQTNFTPSKLGKKLVKSFEREKGGLILMIIMVMMIIMMKDDNDDDDNENENNLWRY